VSAPPRDLQSLRYAGAPSPLDHAALNTAARPSRACGGLLTTMDGRAARRGASGAMGSGAPAHGC